MDYVQGNRTELLRRSLLGQVRAYNKLSQAVVDAGTVKAFQRNLQNLLKRKVTQGVAAWQHSYSARFR